MKNPAWTRDELILALDLYKQFAGSPSKGSKEVVELSSTLNRLNAGLQGRQADFRNPNGVYMKIMNFRRFDENFTKLGRKGLARGNKLEQFVWKHFLERDDLLRATAQAICEQVTTGEAINDDDGPDLEAEEGRILARVHRQRERNKKLVTEKKRRAFKAKGKLDCEACGFDFSEVYGERGDGFIEAHHTRPLHTLSSGDKTRLDDLALLCSNCHRMIHAKTPWLTLDQLLNVIRTKTVKL